MTRSRWRGTPRSGWARRLLRFYLYKGLFVQPTCASGRRSLRATMVPPSSLAPTSPRRSSIGPRRRRGPARPRRHSARASARSGDRSREPRARSAGRSRPARTAPRTSPRAPSDDRLAALGLERGYVDAACQALPGAGTAAPPRPLGDLGRVVALFHPRTREAPRASYQRRDRLSAPSPRVRVANSPDMPRTDSAATTSTRRGPGSRAGSGRRRSSPGDRRRGRRPFLHVAADVEALLAGRRWMSWWTADG